MLEFDLILKLLVHFIYWKKVKQRYVKPLYKPTWLISMKRLGVLLLPPGWDANLSQGYPQHVCCYPFVHLGAEKHCESKVSCLRTQHSDSGQGSSALTIRPPHHHHVKCLNFQTLLLNCSSILLTEKKVNQLYSKNLSRTVCGPEKTIREHVDFS